jgi:small subunit ribosomal protein S15
MARMHARRRGKSGSKHPIREEHPEWSALNPKEVENKVIELAKEGKSASQIGMILRDQYAVPDVKVATGKKIAKILEEHGLQTELPEDLKNLISRAVKIKRHLDQHKKDLKNKRNLQLVESKIRRLVKYYKEEGRLPEEWGYSIESAKLIAE